MMMVEARKLTAFLALAIAGATAWKSTLALEYDSPGCGGHVNHAWVGFKWRQIKMGNTTQSVFTSTVNDGIYRWYGFSAATADGAACDGELVGRVDGSCFDLTSYAMKGKPVVKCIRYCTLWADADDPLSCAFFGGVG